METLALLLACGEKNAADRLDRAALAADHAAHIALGDADLETDVLTVRDLVNGHRVGLADEGSNDLFDSFLHEWLLSSRSFFHRCSFLGRSSLSCGRFLSGSGFGDRSLLSSRSLLSRSFSGSGLCGFSSCSSIGFSLCFGFLGSFGLGLGLQLRLAFSLGSGLFIGTGLHCGSTLFLGLDRVVLDQ